MKWPDEMSSLKRVEWCQRYKPECPRCGTKDIFIHGPGVKCRDCKLQFEVQENANEMATNIRTE